MVVLGLHETLTGPAVVSVEIEDAKEWFWFNRGKPSSNKKKIAFPNLPYGPVPQYLSWTENGVEKFRNKVNAAYPPLAEGVCPSFGVPFLDVEGT